MTKVQRTPETTRLRKTQRLLFLAFIAVVLIFSVWFIGFCRIREINVSGAVFSDAENIVASCGIKTGTHTYSVNKTKIAEKIKAENIYVRSVSVRRSLPSKINIIIEEYEPAFYIEYEENFFILSDKLTVLEVRHDISGDFYKNTARLTLSGLKGFETGKAVIFENEDDLSFYRDIIGKILASPVGEKLSGVDLSDRFDIHILYNNLYTIVLSSWRNIDSDLSLCIRLIEKIESDPYYANVTGNIRVISDDKISFQPTGKIGE